MEYSNEDLLDLSIIQGLKEMNDEENDFFKEILGLYNEQYPELYGKIKQSAISNDLESLSKTAHALKGASLNIGAKELAAVCKTVELNSKNGVTEGIPDMIEKIQHVYVLTMNAMSSI
ncbi:MAG: Hpt domain-containing protein [Bacteroidetes bacterium]|nr:Hpt domain-containing protein [Bacteroidota bacterium]